MLDKINESTSNLTAGKLYTTGENKYMKHKCKPNLTTTQLQTIKDLRSNPNIIIKPADKGGAIVVMATEAYKFEVYRQLHNLEYLTSSDVPRHSNTSRTSAIWFT